MNWHERIEQARAVGRFTLDDKALASRWVTCACGGQDERIPRTWRGMPKDDQLLRLGLAFTAHVELGSIERAAMTLKEIDARATELLAELPQ